MTREQIKDFTLRTSEANSCDLIVILYDCVLTDVSNARAAFKEGCTDAYRSDLGHAMRCLNELLRCLDFSVPLSYDLGSLYTFLNRQISYATAGNHLEALDIVDEVINRLRASFATIAKDDPNGPMMKNTQTVYAGLTYGKGFLNETYVDPRDYNRGFNA